MTTAGTDTGDPRREPQLPAELLKCPLLTELNVEPTDIGEMFYRVLLQHHKTGKKGWIWSLEAKP